MILWRTSCLFAALLCSTANSWAKPATPQPQKKIPAWLKDQLLYGLCDSARKGDTVRMEELLKRGADINGRDMRKAYWGNGFCYGVLPIFAAIEGRSLPAVRFLISHGASLRGTVTMGDLEITQGEGPFNDFSELTPADAAARLDELEIVACLNNANAPSMGDGEYESETELELTYRVAASYNALKVMKWLLDAESQSEPLAKEEQVRLASFLLPYAAKYDHAQMIDLLLGFGADSKSCGQALLKATDKGNFTIALQLTPHATLGKDERGMSALAYTVEKLWSPYTTVDEIPDLKGAEISADARKKLQDQLDDHTKNKKLGPPLLTALMDKGANPNEVFPAGYTPLLLAAERGNAPYVKVLLEKGANPNLAPKPFPSPLRLVANVGYLAHSRRTLDLQFWGNPAGRRQAEVKDEQVDVEVATLLLNHGADPREGDNRFALGEAIKNGNRSLTKLLLDYGTDPNLAFVPRPYFESPDLRGQWANLKAVRWMEDERNGQIARKTAPKWQYPLLLAAEGGQTGIVADLLKAGANATYSNSFNQNALHCLAENGTSALFYGAGTSIQQTASSEPGYLSIRAIPAGPKKVINDWAKKNDTAIAQMLLQAGCSPDQNDHKDRSPRRWAAVRSHPAVFQILLKAASNPIRTSDIFEVIQEGRWQSLSKFALISLQGIHFDWDRRKPDSNYGAGAHKEWQTWVHKQSAQVAAEHTQLRRDSGTNDAQVISMLIAAGAPIEERNSDGLTPLLLAARLGQIEVVQALLKAGANVNAKNRGGETILQQITRYGPQTFRKLPLTEIGDPKSESWMSLAVVRQRIARIRQILADENAPLIKLLRQHGAR